MRLLVRAVTSVDGINRMVYDVTSKPTGTIEPAGDNRRPVRRNGGNIGYLASIHPPFQAISAV
jgi:hypothetical protein